MARQHAQRRPVSSSAFACAHDIAQPSIAARAVQPIERLARLIHRSCATSEIVRARHVEECMRGAPAMSASLSHSRIDARKALPPRKTLEIVACGCEPRELHIARRVASTAAFPSPMNALTVAEIEPAEGVAGVGIHSFVAAPRAFSSPSTVDSRQSFVASASASDGSRSSLRGLRSRPRPPPACGPQTSRASPSECTVAEPGRGGRDPPCRLISSSRILAFEKLVLAGAMHHFMLQVAANSSRGSAALGQDVLRLGVEHGQMHCLGYDRQFAFRPQQIADFAFNRSFKTTWLLRASESSAVT